MCIRDRNINSGEILSLISLPDFDINKRNNISDKMYINRATKGVYEFGSVFKTFTIAAGFNEKLIEPKDMFNNLEKKINCGGRTISEYDEDLSQNLSVEEILINSGNIGSVKIGQKLGVDKIKDFLIFPGDESKLLKGLEIGCSGCISAIANVTHKLAREVFDNFEKNKPQNLNEKLSAKVF